MAKFMLTEFRILADISSISAEEGGLRLWMVVLKTSFEDVMLNCNRWFSETFGSNSCDVIFNFELFSVRVSSAMLTKIKDK